MYHLFKIGNQYDEMEAYQYNFILFICKLYKVFKTLFKIKKINFKNINRVLTFVRNTFWLKKDTITA